MPYRAPKPCSVPGCGELTHSGRCEAHTRQAEQARGTAKQRGYDRRHELLFRERVLTRDPVCVLCGRRWATQADHYPLSRRELVARGMNPNDPDNGRGLCGPCHSKATAEHQPGGFHAQ